MAYQSIIVGIDPGTTSAYACLSLDGDVLEVYSSKEMDLPKMIQYVSDKGLPVIVASDKLNVPDFVKQFASKTSARLVKLGTDVQVEQKRELTRDFDTANDHERDALASAILAFKRHRALIDKIKRYVSIHDKDNIKDRIAHYVLAKEISIDLATKLIEEGNKKEVKAIKNIVDKKNHNYLRLLENYNKLLEEKEILVEENRDLKTKLKNEADKNKRLREKSAQEAIDLKVRSKNQYINKLEKNVQDEKKTSKKLQQELQKINKLISKNMLIGKRVRNLSKSEIEEKSKIFRVKDNDILCIDDPHSFSNSVIDELRGRNIIMVTQKPGKELQDNFSVIYEKELNMKKTQYYCFIDKTGFEDALENKNVLRRVIEDYKKTRE